MKLLMKIGFAMLVLAVVLVGTSFGVLRAQDTGRHSNTYVNGNHTMKSETRTVGADVAVIEMDGPVDITVKQGSTPSMIVVGEENLIPLVKTEQHGDKLTIDLKDAFFRLHRPLRVDLTLPSLRELTSRGSGDSIVSGFKGDQLKLSIHGSGDIRVNGAYQHVSANTMGSGDMDLALGDTIDVDFNIMGSGGITTSGTSKSLVAHLMGSGDLGADEMMADSVKVDVMGSGDSNVYAKQVAILDVKGSGDINVHGNPVRREVNRMGSGDINWN